MEEDLALFAMEYASKLGADYVDARLEEHYNELIIVLDGKAQRAVVNRKQGIGIRTFVNGAWGFQSTTGLNKKSIRQTAEIAAKMAKASSRHVPTPVKLSPTKSYDICYETKVKVGLENVAFEDNLRQIVNWRKSRGNGCIWTEISEVKYVHGLKGRFKIVPWANPTIFFDLTSSATRHSSGSTWNSDSSSSTFHAL